MKNHKLFWFEIIAATLAGVADRACASAGYEAMDYLVYPRFNSSGETTPQAVRMFDVKIVASEWLIRTEPVIEGKGIGFYEVSSSTNNFVLRVTGFDTAYKSSESPFQELRRELQDSKKADGFFPHPPPPAIPPSYSKAVLPSALPRQNGEPFTNKADHVAIAVVLKGKYPPVAQCYGAFVWFAFTTPNLNQ